jgi:predicted nucleic acid-binding protein
MCTTYYMIVLDASALIHMAKLTLLETVCTHYRACTSELVRREVVSTPEKHPDASIIQALIGKQTLSVKKAKSELVKRANALNIFGGEAEALATYWQEKANFLVSDDDNVRKKQLVANVPVVGTPAMLLTLLKKKLITHQKFEKSSTELNNIGWFNPAVIDYIRKEGLQWNKQ